MDNNPISYYNQEALKALDEINKNLPQKITLDDLQKKLSDKLGIPLIKSHRVAEYFLTSEQMVAYLKDENMSQPIVLKEITLDKSLLKGKGRLDEKKIKISGEIWIIHKYDADSCPSNPHAHHVGTGNKLHLGDGGMYDYKCNYLDYRIGKKQLTSIREMLSDFTLPILTR